MAGRSAGPPPKLFNGIPAIGISQMHDHLLGCVGPDRREPSSRVDGPGSDGYVAQSVPDLNPTPPRSSPSCTIAIDPSPPRAPYSVGARVPRRGTRGFPTCGSGRARRIRPLLAMAGRGAAAPPAKTQAASAPAGRGGAPPPPVAGAGHGALVSPAQRPPAGSGATQATQGRGNGRLGVRPPGQPLQAMAGRGGLRPPALGLASVAQPAAGRDGPRPQAPGAAVVATAGRGGAALGAVQTPTAGQPRGAPPPHFVVRPAHKRSGQSQTTQNSNTRGSYDPPRGQWGDDGYDVYGDGQHRGSSSTGGGRGYAWQSDGSAERPFLGPPGGFVEGASGPDHRQRGGHRGHRGGRGGGRGRYHRRPPPPSAVVDQAESVRKTDNATAELPPQAMEVVAALANVEAPATGSVTEATDRSEAERASKWARKKDRMLCYRCGEKGHFIADCVAELCESCGKPAHASGDCPLLRDQAPSLTMYGVYCAELMFFESPAAREIPEETLSLTTGVVKATQGEVSEAQIVQRLQELAPGDFHWELVPLEAKVFKVEFPSMDDLQRLLSFGLCRVPGTRCILEFHEWQQVEPKGKPLTQVWLRFSGAPSKPLQDVRVVASMGIMVGKTEKVDMAFTRAHGVARILVSVLDIEFVSDVVNWTYRGEVFPLEIEFEDAALFADAMIGNDVDMHEGDDNAGAEGAQTDESTREGTNDSRPVAQSGDGTGVEPAPSPSVPMTSLRFGSFEPASAPPRLWSDRVDSDEAFEQSLPLLEFEDAGGALAGCSVRTSSVRILVGSGDGESVVASPEALFPLGVAAAAAPSVALGEGGLGQAALTPTSPFTSLTSASLVMTGPAGAGSGGPRQAASALSPSGVAAAHAPSVASGEGDLGQVALTPLSSPAVRRTASPSPVAAPEPLVALGEWGMGQAVLTPSSPAVRRTASPSPVAAPAPLVALGEGGVGQAALTPPSSTAVRRSEPPPSIPVVMGLGLGHLSEGHGSPQAPPPVSLVDPSRVSARGVTREEVVAFGGIPDPASAGRRMSARIQELPEVDDMQQRCAMRAAKLHDAAISTGYFPSYGRDPFMVATHSDGGQGAFGYWIYTLGDGSSGYLQPVWITVM
ncbi:uncharacterized protein [Aegilops tauschii subsp. strangulata]|uniref:uncharacterized protein isoform X1 n=1 Tax=Aegilops tauschii subsp. strangulata TaxID=200361 RepID=UPI003CC8D2DD